MPNYTYVATNSIGEAIRGKERAETVDELLLKLQNKNLHCSSYKEQKDLFASSSYKFKLSELAFICRQLSAMLNAGISLVKAMEILYTQEEKPKPKKVFMEIYENLQKGSSFSEAINQSSGVFPNLFVSMVTAGETGGNLDTVMDRISGHYIKENKLKHKISSSMVYPIILLVMIVGVVIVMFCFILPQFVDLFKSPEDIPPLTAVMLGLSDFMIDKWYICIIIVVAIVVGIKLLLKYKRTRFYFDKMICKMPKVGKLLTTIYTSRFARTMSNLFASGLLMVDCIEKSVQTLGNSYVSTMFEGVIDDVKKGEPLSKSIAKTNIFEGIFTSTIYVGEESGSLEGILNKTADFYDEEADTAITKMVSLMEPLMIVILGLVVMLVLGSVFPAIYGSFAGMAE